MDSERDRKLGGGNQKSNNRERCLRNLKVQKVELRNPEIRKGILKSENTN